MIEPDREHPNAADLLDITNVRPCDLVKPRAGECAQPWQPSQMRLGLLSCSVEDAPCLLV
jgi:hypothetical protein